jgi:hypothetical protein
LGSFGCDCAESGVPGGRANRVVVAADISCDTGDGSLTPLPVGSGWGVDGVKEKPMKRLR